VPFAKVKLLNVVADTGIAVMAISITIAMIVAKSLFIFIKKIPPFSKMKE
jgi:hypothetical protein